MKTMMNSRRGIAVALSLLLLLVLTVPAFADEVTGSGTVTGGTLNMAASDDPAFPAVTLSGTDQTSSDSIDISANDETGTGAGWKLQVTATQFSTGGTPNRQLTTSALSITGASAVCASGTCTAPTNSVTYPVNLTAGDTAVSFFNAAVDTGMGDFTVTPTLELDVPANTYAGTYTSTVTITIGSAP